MGRLPGKEAYEATRPRPLETPMREAGPAQEAVLIAHCPERLSPIKCPKSVDFEAELPRHPTGKPYKRLLKARYWARHASKII